MLRAEAMMQTIGVGALKPGMRTGQAVRALNGRMLLPGGAVLNRQTIRLLKIWGVLDVAVDESPAQDGEASDDPLREVAQMEIAPRFARARGTKVGEALFEIAVEERIAALKEGIDEPSQARTVPKSDLEVEIVEIPDPEDMVHSEVRLSSLPAVYYKILETLDSPSSTAGQAAQAVGADPSLAARLLKLVNSPIYAQSRKIEDLEQAVLTLGFGKLSSAAAGVFAVTFFKDAPKALFSMRGFWEHSIAAAVAAQALAALTPDLSEDRLFLAGLMHDLGKLLLVKKAGPAFRRALLLAQTEGIELHVAERRVMGYDHATVGGLLVKAWRMPEALADAVRGHHDPDNAVDPRAAVVVQAADATAAALGRGSGGAWTLPVVADASWERLGLSTAVLAQVARLLERRLAETLAAFLPEEAKA